MSVQFSAVSAPVQPEESRSATLPALGDLAAVAALLRPGGPAQPRWVVFGADHGIAAASVSPELPDRTGARLAALAAGVGPLSALAAATGVGIRPVDLRDPAPDDANNAWGGYQPSSRIDTLDALTGGEVVQAVEAGSAAADAEADSGADLLIGAVCSVAASTAVAVLAAAITGMEPVDAVTRGGGIDDAAWIRKVAAVRDALYRAKLSGTDAVTLLRVAGGADLAALTGFVAQSAVRGIPVLLDGTTAVACGILAHRLAPGADAWMITVGPAHHRSHARLIEVLGRALVRTAGTRFGSGSAAALLVPTLRAVEPALATPEAPLRRAWPDGLL